MKMNPNKLINKYGKILKKDSKYLPPLTGYT